MVKQEVAMTDSTINHVNVEMNHSGVNYDNDDDDRNGDSKRSGDEKCVELRKQNMDIIKIRIRRMGQEEQDRDVKTVIWSTCQNRQILYQKRASTTI